MATGDTRTDEELLAATGFEPEAFLRDLKILNSRDARSSATRRRGPTATRI